MRFVSPEPCLSVHKLMQVAKGPDYTTRKLTGYALRSWLIAYFVRFCFQLDA